MNRGKGEDTALRASKLSLAYGKRIVLKDVCFDVRRGEVLSVIGHNGAGKSTLLKGLFGLVPLRQGQIEVEYERVIPTPSKMLALGVRYLPQRHKIFEGLSVDENLRIASRLAEPMIKTDEQREREEFLNEAFPELENMNERKAGSLSGGEQQMLALKMCLQGEIRMLFLDEVSVGLTDVLMRRVLEWLQLLSERYRIGVVLVEQKVKAAIEVSDRVCVLKRGEVVYLGGAGELRSETGLKKFFL